MKLDFVKSVILVSALMLIAVLPILAQDSESAYGQHIIKPNYELSRSYVDRKLAPETFFEDVLTVSNLKSEQISLSLSISGDVAPIISLASSTVTVDAKNETSIRFKIFGKKIGSYNGTIAITGGFEEHIPVSVIVTEEDLTSDFFLEIIPSKTKFNKNSGLEFKVDIHKLISGEYNITMDYALTSLYDNSSHLIGEDVIVLSEPISLLKKVPIPKNLTLGNYLLTAEIRYSNMKSDAGTIIVIKNPFYSYRLFGIIPLWMVLILLALLFLLIMAIILVRRYIESKKKYHVKVDLKTLPKKGDNVIYLGKIAETNVDMYLETAQLATHVIDAGATGGGKSISAQVIAEEALLKGACVIVFDPTAQWSGMLRKCKDKKMFSFYPQFSMKTSDAKAFNGNVRQITDAREVIDIKKYIKPGEIQIFTISRLDPKDIDVFMVNTINSIFHANLPESQDLKVILIYDEVHRLLSRFGGSGEGFIQVERACREFRKWGIGVMLISQVLSDFVGAIKANISTELQMRTRDEGDLERIRTKYGDDALRALVKASVGVGMFVNTAYNHGKPILVQFRPILHSVTRMDDEELEKYNQYNDLIDDLEYQIDQLEKEGLDVFDLRLELKLALDKVKSGNFNMVDIYLEGLKPRLDSQWVKLGKKPTKRVVKLIDEAALKKSLEEAKKSREKYEAETQSAAAKVEKKEEEDPFKKNYAPITFNNGMMVSSLQELKEVFELMDEDLFKAHVNEKKNDIADWVNKAGLTELAGKLSSAKTKGEMYKILEDEKKAKAKKPEDKAGEKKEEKK